MDKLSRISKMTLDGGQLCEYDYLGMSTAVTTRYFDTDVSSPGLVAGQSYATGGSGADRYAGFDRFGRIIETQYYHSHPHGSSNFSKEDVTWGNTVGEGLLLVAAWCGNPRGGTSLLTPERVEIQTVFGTVDYPSGQGWDIDSSGGLISKPGTVPNLPGG